MRGRHRAFRSTSRLASVIVLFAGLWGALPAHADTDLYGAANEYKTSTRRVPTRTPSTTSWYWRSSASRRRSSTLRACTSSAEVSPELCLCLCVGEPGSAQRRRRRQRDRRSARADAGSGVEGSGRAGHGTLHARGSWPDPAARAAESAGRRAEMGGHAAAAVLAGEGLRPGFPARCTPAQESGTGVGRIHGDAGWHGAAAPRPVCVSAGSLRSERS